MNSLLGYPAASINGDTFVIAAQKAGLGTDIDTLNMIVNLVNQGIDPDQAANLIAKNYGIQQPMQTNKVIENKGELSVDAIMKMLSSGLLGR